MFNAALGALFVVVMVVLLALAMYAMLRLLKGLAEAFIGWVARTGRRSQ